MTTDNDPHSQGALIAGGAIATALIEVLFDKGILSLDDGRAVLDRAQKGLGTHIKTNATGAYEAGQIIAGLMRGKFSAR